MAWTVIISIIERVTPDLESKPQQPVELGIQRRGNPEGGSGDCGYLSPRESISRIEQRKWKTCKNDGNAQELDPTGTDICASSRLALG